jgi:hypothetical protein
MSDVKILYLNGNNGDLTHLQKAFVVAKNSGIQGIVYGGDFCGGYNDFEKFYGKYSGLVQAILGSGIDFIQTFGDTDFMSAFLGQANSVLLSNPKYAAISHNQRIFQLGRWIYSIPFVCDDRFMIKNLVAIDDDDKALWRENVSRRQIGDSCYILYKEGKVVVETRPNYCAPTIMSHLTGTMESRVELGSLYIFHSPPSNCGISKDFNGVCRGSKDIRKFIEKQKPQITLHGHVTNHFIEDYQDVHTHIGDTMCVNPGRSNFVVLTFSSTGKLSVEAHWFDKF